MAIPSFLFFSVYCVVNVYLSVFFRNMGYSATLIGFLLGLFEISGIVFTLILSKFPAKTGKYGLWMLLLGIFATILAFPVFLSPFPVMCISLLLLAIPVKSIVPISDAFIHLRLADKHEQYGMIRAFGSLGFVVMTLIMQNTVNVDTISRLDSALWTAAPPLLMSLSLVFIPKLLKPIFPNFTYKVASVQSENDCTDEKRSFLKNFSPLYWLIIAVVTFANLTQYGASKFFSLYVKEYLGSDSFGFLWAISVICEIPALFLSYRFIRRFGSKNLILFAVAMTSIRSFVYVIFPSVAGATFAQLFHFITFGLLHPSLVLFVAQEVKNPKYAVTAQAISSVGSAGIASVVGSFIGGIIIDHYGYAELYTIFGFFPLIGLVMYFFLRKKV